MSRQNTGNTASETKSVPNAPTGAVATNLGSGRAVNNGSASVSFTTPFDGKMPITGYTVTPSPATSPATFTGATSPITVTNLASATAYTYTITATNAIGTSAASAASAAVTATTISETSDGATSASPRETSLPRAM